MIEQKIYPISSPEVEIAALPDEYYYCGVHFEPCLGWTLTDLRCNSSLMISEDTAKMLIEIWKDLEAAAAKRLIEIWGDLEAPKPEETTEVL